LRDERRLRASVSRVLRQIFGPVRQDVTGDWRKMHNDKLHDVYSSQNIIQVIDSRIMPFATSCRLANRVNVVHFADRTNSWRREIADDSFQIKYTKGR
jgi:hypothetical protein